ncbi:DNA-binding protein [Candidatus Uhrbacteria bacterium]|nr:DNA-binding protein [Candidatus Uhrbacteria bacterium]
MKRILSDGERSVLRFDEGEEVITGVIKFCNEAQIKAGSFIAVGACQQVILSYYDLERKVYEDHDIKKEMEIVCVHGNIGTVNGSVIIHAHGSFSDRQLEVKGGHIKKLIISATAEVILTKLSGEIQRLLDEKTGLRLMTPSQEGAD